MGDSLADKSFISSQCFPHDLHYLIWHYWVTDACNSAWLFDWKIQIVQPVYNQMVYCNSLCHISHLLAIPIVYTEDFFIWHTWSVWIFLLLILWSGRISSCYYPLHSMSTWSLSGAEDIHSGNLKLILGMVWRLILRYQIGRGKTPPKKLMLAWINAVVPGQSVTNFNTDWNDGIALQYVLSLSCSSFIMSYNYWMCHLCNTDWAFGAFLAQLFCKNIWKVLDLQLLSTIYYQFLVIRWKQFVNTSISKLHTGYHSTGYHSIGGKNCIQIRIIISDMFRFGGY